jgi:GrpB-like predicted nucleotidyltransferase (UPF0157 family)
LSYQVNIEDYNPKWVSLFNDEKKKIVEVLGNKGIAIEHIGSTSVKGLVAKPIIDIAVAVKELGETDSFVDSLQSIGYEYVPKAEFPKRRFFRKGEWRKGTHHLHVYEIMSVEWRKNLLFRDYLRKHPDKLHQYAKLKGNLAAMHPDDRTTYTNEKAPFIQEIIDLARKESF